MSTQVWKIVTGRYEKRATTFYEDEHQFLGDWQRLFEETKMCPEYYGPGNVAVAWEQKPYGWVRLMNIEVKRNYKREYTTVMVKVGEEE